MNKEERALTKKKKSYLDAGGAQLHRPKSISSSVTLFLFYMGLTVVILLLMPLLLNPHEGGLYCFKIGTVKAE